MPNTLVPAPGEAMPSAKFDRRAIMQAAWANYRRWHAVRESIHGPRPFDRKEFAWKLRCAWDAAKQQAMNAIERRAEAVRREIDALKFKSFHININQSRTQLEAELSALTA